LFILLLVAMSQVFSAPVHRPEAFVGAFGLALMIIALDILMRRKNIAVLSAVFFGLLAGFLMSLLFGAVIQITPWIASTGIKPEALTAALTVILSYIAISVIMQTKDDFRFVIPYIEFSKETKGGRPVVLDTSVIIDGRIADLCETGIFDSELIVPRFVLQELQTVADSADKLKRNRGRRGLDMLNRLQSSDRIDIRIHDAGTTPSGQDVDAQLVNLAKELNGRVITNDYNLNKVAQFRGVTVLNINDMANALKPVVLPGEPMKVTIVKPGEEAGQGVGYLEDGTMVVVEGARDMLNQEVQLSVTSVLQTSAGRMIFGRIEGTRDSRQQRPKPKAGGRDEPGPAGQAPPPPPKEPPGA
jgi:uncharacterized protein YacL